jgi:hypothetical protein
MDFTGGTMFSNISSYTDANRVSIGDESATVFLAATVAGGAGAGDFAILSQFIEGVSRLAGKTVTISFWANASAGTPKLGVGVRQSFGTGGSPSANVDVAGQSVTLSATPARYTLTFAVPSMAGKTFGSNADTAYTRIAFALSSGSTNAAIFGTPGVQSTTVALWGTQLEFGSAATALESRDRALELMQCQRFYQVANIQLYGYQAASNIIAMAKTLTVTMRIAPSIVYQPSVATNVTGAGVNALGGDAVNVFGTATATGPANIQGIYLASADY